MLEPKLGRCAPRLSSLRLIQGSEAIVCHGHSSTLTRGGLGARSPWQPRLADFFAELIRQSADRAERTARVGDATISIWFSALGEPLNGREGAPASRWRLT